MKNKTTDQQAQSHAKAPDVGDGLAAKLRQAADKCESQASTEAVAGGAGGLLRRLLDILLAEFLKDKPEGE